MSTPDPPEIVDVAGTPLQPAAATGETIGTEIRGARLSWWVALVIVFILPWLVYWRATLGLGMFYFGDIARFFFPTRLLYADGLRDGRLPFWQPEILTGLPLFAEMQTGALYPLHLLLYRLLPTELALNYDILFHLAALGVGAFLFARVRRISIAGSMLTAFALALGGFGAARITHPNVLAVAAWLPWLLWLYELWRRGTFRVSVWLLLVAAFALQWLGGHPQFALINLLTFTAYVGAMALANLPRPLHWRVIVSEFAPPFGALALGTLIASVQLVPTFEFAAQSARAGGVDADFFASFSYHPFYLALLVAPFLRGNPYPNTSVEVFAYLGIVPLVFALCGIWLRRGRREIWFWVAFALVSLLLALGGNTPLYPALRNLPLFNFFRVPARFLLPFTFALAILAGFGFDALRQRTFVSKIFRNAWLIGLGTLALLLVILILTLLLPIEAWLDAWRILPILFGALVVLLVLRADRTDRYVFTLAALGLTLIDLFCLQAVYALSYNRIAPRAEVFPRPRVLDVLPFDEDKRVLTSEWVIPWTSVMNESLYPNLNAIHAVAGAHGYTPLTPRNTREFLTDPSPIMLNKLGAQYFLIPQLLPVDAATEAADVRNPFLLDPIAAPVEFSIVDSDSVQIDSALAQSVTLPTGAVVADIVLTDESGKTYSVPLQAGLDTAEWAYDRSDVQKVVQHERPEVASSYPARSAFPIEAHTGNTFRTRINFAPQPVPIVSIQIVPRIDPGLLHIHSVALLNGDAALELAPLLNQGRHTLVYRSEDVAVYENPDAVARALITHNVKQATDEEAFAQLRSDEPNAEIYVSEGPEFETDIGQGFNERADIVLAEAERLVIDTQLESEGYLVVNDAWDAGWIALVDGVPTPIVRADVIFRAVLLDAGSHRVEFLYRPRSFYVGVVLSGIGIAMAGIAVLVVMLSKFRRPAAPSPTVVLDNSA